MHSKKSLKDITDINKLFINIGRVFISVASILMIIASGFLIFLGVWDFINSFPKIFRLVSVYKAHHVEIAVQFISAIDLFMVSVVMYVMGIGLFELFVSKKKTIIYPHWLQMCDLNDFKRILLSAVVVVISITFLKHIVTWQNPIETFYFGAAIAIFIGSITFFSKWVVTNEVKDLNGQKECKQNNYDGHTGN